MSTWETRVHGRLSHAWPSRRICYACQPALGVGLLHDGMECGGDHACRLKVSASSRSLPVTLARRVFDLPDFNLQY